MAREMITARIEQLLAASDLSQADLSRATGLPGSTISRYLTGERIPSSANLGKIARAFGVTADSLLREDVPVPEPVCPTAKRRPSPKEEIAIAREILERNIDHIPQKEKMAMIRLLSRKRGENYGK